MNILFTTFRYFSLTGSETFTYGLLKELSGQHKIFLYSPFLGGKIWQKSKNLNIFASSHIEDFTNEKIDLIHAQHNLTAVIARYHFPQAPIIFLKHGISSFLEMPPEFVKFNYYGAISPEIARSYQKQTVPAKKIFVFPNSVDTRRFSPVGKLPVFPRRILVISNYLNRQGKKIVVKAAKKMNLKISFLGKNKQVFDTAKAINKADIVMSLGRGIIESMSCGKAVIVFTYDNNHYKNGDGMVTEKNIDKIAFNNFSGRALNIPYNEKNLIKAIEQYRPSMGLFNRQYVLNHFDLKTNLPGLIKAYAQASHENALACDQKQVDFVARTAKEILAYEKLIYRYRPFSQLLFRRFKDQIIAR